MFCSAPIYDVNIKTFGRKLCQKCVYIVTIPSATSGCNTIYSLFNFIIMTAIFTDNSIFLIWAATWQNQQCGCVPREDSDQPGHSPSLIRVFAVRMKKAWVLSYPLSAQQRLWSDWADAQADLSLHWAPTHFVGLVTLWLNFSGYCIIEAKIIPVVKQYFLKIFKQEGC